MVIISNLYPVNILSQVLQSLERTYLKTEDDAAKLVFRAERDSFAAFTKTLDWVAELNRQYIYSMLRLSDDIGTMADRIGVMADRILYTELQIGAMADRIIEFSKLQSDNMNTTLQWVTNNFSKILKLLKTYGVNQNL